MDKAHTPIAPGSSPAAWPWRNFPLDLSFHLCAFFQTKGSPNILTTCNHSALPRLSSDRDQGWPMPRALSCSWVTLPHLGVPGCSWKSGLKQAWVAPRSPWGWEGKVNKILLSTAETNCSSAAWQMGPKRETICFRVKA